MTVPEEVECLVLFVDRDSGGRRAEELARQRFGELRIETRTTPAPAKDWNECRIVAEAADDEPGRKAAGSDATTEAAMPAKPQLSRRLVDELAMQRRDILAVHVAADPPFAQDLATFLMIDREGRHAFRGCGSSLSAPAPSDPVFDFRTPDAAATIAGARAREALDRAWTAGATPAERFDAFRALPANARAAWLGHAVARTLEASVQQPSEQACPFHDHVGAILGIDVAAWWRPTGANYFDRVPKSLALDALAEVGGPELAGRHAKAKKAELAEACERIFAGDVIADLETKAAALAWVPPAMRFGDAPVVVANAESALPDETISGSGEVLEPVIPIEKAA